jgi:hypothetical protein
MLNHVSTLIFDFKFIKIILILNLHAHKNIKNHIFPIFLLFKFLGCYTQGSGPDWQSHEEEAPWPSVLAWPISSAWAQASKGRKGDFFSFLFSFSKHIFQINLNRF